MASKSKSREHHWWPVALQKHWADRNGDVSWIDPEGKIQKKRAKNRKIAYKSHGHTVFRGDDWEANFEDEFSIADDGIPKVIETLTSLKPLGRTPGEFFGLIRLLLKHDRQLCDMCKFYHLDEKVHRKLLLLICSLLIRSPGNRNIYENYPSLVGLPSNEEVGKMNMAQTYQTAKELCETGFISNQYFVFIHSPLKQFIFGDGNLDWLTGNLIMNRVDGRALVPLTPHLCVYFCTPHSMLSTPNCASLSAAPWMVDWINNLVQIYSRDKLFFLVKPPVLTEVFQKRQFLALKQREDKLIDMLDEVSGIRRGDQFPTLGLNF